MSLFLINIKKTHVRADICLIFLVIHVIKAVFFYGLVDRAILLSHPIFQEKNLEYVIRVLIKNVYSIDLIFHKINHRIKEFSSRSHLKKQEQNLNNNE